MISTHSTKGEGRFIARSKTIEKILFGLILSDAALVLNDDRTAGGRVTAEVAVVATVVVAIAVSVVAACVAVVAATFLDYLDHDRATVGARP